MDITLHKLDTIIELLKEIKSKPLMVRGEVFDDTDPPSGIPEESVVGDTYTIPYDAQWNPAFTHTITPYTTICNCTEVLEWHHCPRHGYCK